MAKYTGTLGINTPIAPKDDADTNATHSEEFGLGGFRSVADLTARDAIPAARRKEGMEVKVLSNGLRYELIGGTANANWREVIESTTFVRDKNFCYNIDNGLSIYRSAVSKMKASTAGMVDVLLLGNSIWEGVGTSDFPTTGGSTVGLTYKTGIAERLKSHFATKYSDVGFGCIPLWFPANGVPLKWVFNGFAPMPNFGPYKAAKFTTTLGHTATLTFNGTGIDIIIGKNSACGKMNVAIDGGAATVIETYSATEVQAFKISIDSLSDGEHTVVISPNETGKAIILCHAIPKKGTKGVRFHNLGKASSRASEMIPTNSQDFLQSTIDIFAPKLTIIGHFCNEPYFDETVESYVTSMQALITRAKQFGDVLLAPVGIWNPDAVTGHPSQTPYYDAVLKLAKDNNCCFVDCWSRWKGDFNYASGTLGFLTDNIHPNDAGAMDIASGIIYAIDY